MHRPDPAAQRRIAKMVGFAPREWIAIERGYTAARRYVVQGEGGSAFIKIATTPLTARLLNQEIVNYRALPLSCMPRLLGWHADEQAPMLAIEDLSGAVWPPPWNDVLAARVIEQIRALHRQTGDLPQSRRLAGFKEGGWLAVRSDPEPFLSLGLVSRDWLNLALPPLIAAEQACDLAGQSILHLDLRSDNICMDGDVVKFIDWPEAEIGNPDVDIGFFLPSLAQEGGPLPETVLPDAPEIAALVSGFFAARAGLPTIADAPHVRRVQREQLSTALPWAQRALGLRAAR